MSLKDKIDMSMRLSDTTKKLLDSIIDRDDEKLREYLQLWNIQFQLYQEMISKPPNEQGEQ